MIPILSGPTTPGEQAHGRGRAGNPIEAIYDTEYRQTVDGHIEGEREIQQREAAKPIVSAQQRLSHRSLSHPASVPPSTAKMPVAASSPAPATSLKP
jgi:hypothetical protein